MIISPPVHSNNRSVGYHFTGECMVPERSWNAGMELEHWNRYVTFLPLTIGRRVLDVACGEGYGSDLLAEAADRVIGVDLNPDNISHALSSYGMGKPNLEFICADACEEPPVEAGSMDVLISFETIEHLPRQSDFLAHAARALAPHGVAVISSPVPHCDPVSGKPYNPYHLRELSAQELLDVLKRHFPEVYFAGQSSAPPFELHRGFDASKDRYIVAIAAKQRPALLGAVMLLMPEKAAMRKGRLLGRYMKSLAYFPRPPRLVMVPLVDPDCANPSDRRRIELVRSGLQELGWEAVVMTREEAVDTPCDMLFIQDRNWRFWAEKAEALKRAGRSLVLTISDLAGADAASKAHHWDAFNGRARKVDRSEERRAMAAFLQRCDLVLAGSSAQAKHLAQVADLPSLPVVVEYDPIDVEIYRPDAVRNAASEWEFRIVWEGFNDNLPYLTILTGVMEKLKSCFPFKLVIATSPERRTPFMGTTDNRRLAGMLFGEDSVEFHEWRSDSIAGVLRSAHVGIVPLLPDDVFSASKPPNKAVIYHHMGLPVVASPSPALDDWIQRSAGGITAAGPDEWLNAFKTLALNPGYSRKLAANGQAAAAQFTPEAVTRRIAKLLAPALGVTYNGQGFAHD